MGTCTLTAWCVGKRYVLPCSTHLEKHTETAQVVSTRYAPHLSGCLGMNGSTRRAAARTAASKVRLGSGAERSSSYQASDAGDSDDGSVSLGGNGGGGKKRKTTNGSGGTNGRGPAANAKKSKMGGPGSGTGELFVLSAQGQEG